MKQKGFVGVFKRSQESGGGSREKRVLYSRREDIPEEVGYLGGWGFETWYLDRVEEWDGKKP